MTPFDPLFLNWIGVDQYLPQPILVGLVLLCILVFVLFPAAVFYSYLERKIGADLQARVGPNRAGPFGFFQPFADLLKFLQKQPAKRSFQQTFWLSVYSMSLYATIAVLPLGSLLVLVNADMMAFVPVLAVLGVALSTLLLGLSQKTISSRFSGIRIFAHCLAGVFPALICVLSVGIHLGAFRWSTIVDHQGFSPFTWSFFSSPFQAIGACVFFISGLICFSIPPLDSGLSRTDLRGGVISSLSGLTLSLFRLSRFYGLFLWASVTVVLFFGGWALPETFLGHLKELEAYWWIQFFELICVLIKAFFLIFFVVWIARVNPRVRVDQVTDLSWKVLSPLSILTLVGTALWIGGGMLF